LRGGLRPDQSAHMLAGGAAALPEEPPWRALARGAAAALPGAVCLAAAHERKNSDGSGFRGGAGGRHSAGR